MKAGGYVVFAWMGGQQQSHARTADRNSHHMLHVQSDWRVS